MAKPVIKNYNQNIFMYDLEVILERDNGVPIHLGDRVYIYCDTILETREGGSIGIDKEISIHPRCQSNGYQSEIKAYAGAMLAPNCALYSYDHGLSTINRSGIMP